MRFGDHGEDDEQFVPPPKVMAELYVGPPVSCETCLNREGLRVRGEITIVTNYDDNGGDFVVLCVPCTKRYANKIGVITETAENREPTQ